MKKKIIGLVEKVTLYGKKQKTLQAKIDTGATSSSIDKSLAKELSLGPIKKSTKVRSAHGRSVRPVVEVKIKIANKIMKADFNITERSHMKYKVLIGLNILKKLDILINPKE